jgi:predicted transcriptional regulator
MTEVAQNDPHRPHDRPTLRAAAHELRSRGLTAQDIAAALKLTEGAVRSLLAHQASHRLETKP